VIDARMVRGSFSRKKAHIPQKGEEEHCVDCSEGRAISSIGRGLGRQEPEYEDSTEDDGGWGPALCMAGREFFECADQCGGPGAASGGCPPIGAGQMMPIVAEHAPQVSKDRG